MYSTIHNQMIVGVIRTVKNGDNNVQKKMKKAW
jgi:hypothetical protein